MLSNQHMRLTNTDSGKHGGKNSSKFEITALVVEGTSQTYVYIIHMGLTVSNMTKDAKVHPLPSVSTGFFFLIRCLVRITWMHTSMRS